MEEVLNKHEQGISFMKKHNRKIRWSAVGLICLAALFWAIFGWDMKEYGQAWAGTLFKALNGGYVGWLVSRYVVELDLSSLPPEHRPLAGLSQAFLIGAFAMALAIGL